MNKKILITGATGGLAKQFLASMEEKDVYTTTRSDAVGDNQFYLDLTNATTFDYSVLDDSWYVLHMAAVSSPGDCGDANSLAYTVNVTETIGFLEKCMASGANVIFFSSDNVYEGGSGVFDEDSETLPSSQYGEMKFKVESHFAGHPKFKVFRLSYIIYIEDKFTGYLEQCRKNGDAAEVFDSFVRSVVAIDDLMAAAVNVVEKWDVANGIINISGPEHLSRYQIAQYYSASVGGELEVVNAVPPPGFYDSRVPEIKTSSLYLEKLIGRPLTSIKDYYMKLNRRK